MTFKSGRKGTATVGGTELPTISWRVNPTAEIVTFKNSKSGPGAPLREATWKDLTGSVVIDLDTDANPFGTPLNIQAGATITNLKLFPYGTADTNSAWTVPVAIVTSTPMEVAVEGKVGLSFEWAASGTFTGPTGYTP